MIQDIQCSIDFMKEVRDLLATCWIPWKTDDERGGHCQLGAFQKVSKQRGMVFCRQSPEVDFIEATAHRLHPELWGCSAERMDFWGGNDSFNTSPAVYINNHLGKDAILAVYDAAIQDLKNQLELKNLCEEVERSHEIARGYFYEDAGAGASSGTVAELVGVAVR